MEQKSGIPTLRFLAFRSACLAIFKANNGAFVVRHYNRYVNDFLKEIRLPKQLKTSLSNHLIDTFQEVNRWWEKHGELFQEKRKIRRTEHFSLYFHLLQWDPQDFAIDDRRTALALIKECPDWPQMQFQLGCAYALTDLLVTFDKIRVRSMSGRLNDHPLYDFWFMSLREHDPIVIWDIVGLIPQQTVSMAFQWAIQHGYKELSVYFWENVSPPQREYIGLLQWRRVCMQAKQKTMFRFLCDELCAINPSGMERITWHIFYYTLTRLVAEDNLLASVKEQNLHRLQFILWYGCPSLTAGLLRSENYRAIQMALQYRDVKVFSILQSHLTTEQLSEARHYFEANESLKHLEMRHVKKALAQRQWSIA